MKNNVDELKTQKISELSRKRLKKKSKRKTRFGIMSDQIDSPDSNTQRQHQTSCVPSSPNAKSTNQLIKKKKNNNEWITQAMAAGDENHVFLPSSLFHLNTNANTPTTMAITPRIAVSCVALDSGLRISIPLTCKYGLVKKNAKSPDPSAVAMGNPIRCAWFSGSRSTTSFLNV